MRGKACLVALVGCLATATAARGYSDMAVTGYVKSFAIAQDAVEIPGTPDGPGYELQNGIRLMLDNVDDRISWQIHYEISPILRSRASPGTNGPVGNKSWRLSDPPASLAAGDHHQVLQNIDRANVQFHFDSGDLTVGRQPITFGMARVINPTDVFLPFDVRTLNTEYRVGVDAIRFQKPLGQLGELDAGVIIGDDGRAANSAAFLQLRTHVGDSDLQFALTRFAEQNLAGAGIQTSLGDFGYWLEFALVTGATDYTRLSTGLDYAFLENVFGLIEYHYNGAGGASAKEYPAIATTTPYQLGSVFLLGRHYLIPGLSVQVSPLWSISAQMLMNLSDQSAFASLAAVYNASQNLYIDLGYYHFLGDGFGATGFGSEYGSNPATIYASLRYYF